jgi:hypothetical protein
MSGVRQSSSGRLQKFNQCGFIGATGDIDAAGSGEGLGYLRRHTKMAHRKRRGYDAGHLCTRHVAVSGSAGEVHHRVNYTGFKRIPESRWKRQSDRAIDDTHFGSNSTRRELPDEIGCTILAGKI